MHAKGSGAYGTFTVTGDISRYTKAGIFSEVGKVTPLFVRFSTVAGERGAADAERDIRGFAIKFYTEAGNWDPTLRSSSSATLCAFPTSTTRSSAIRARACAVRRTTGISGRCCLRPCTR